MVSLQILHADRLERKTTLDVKLRCLTILACLEVYLSLVCCDVRLLFGCPTVLQCNVYFAVLEEEFPGILVLALKRRDHDFLLMREAEQLILA